MFNSNTLDTVIAVVIVLLMLSLVVQSVQQALKKLLKIKSRQIEDSLVDLFEHVIGEKTAASGGLWGRLVQNSPFLRIFGGTHPAEYNAKVKGLYDEVCKGFVQAGRVSQRGKLMLDSVAKSDLLKILESVAPAVLTPDFDERLTSARGEFEELAAAVGSFRPSEFSEHLSVEAREKLARMQGTLRPLIDDVRAYLRGEVVPGADASSGDAGGGAGSGGGEAGGKGGTAAQGQGAAPPALLKDVIKLNAIRLRDVSDLISEAQKAVEEQLALAEQDKNGAAAATALRAGADTLRSLASVVAKFDRSVDQLLANLTKAETWFDTVMQSFEERYARSMRTWGIIISLAVVVLLNANFFDVYKNIAGNDTLRGNLLQMRDDLAKRYEESLARGDQAAAQNLRQLYQDATKDVGGSAAAYTSLGFTPIWQCSGTCFQGGVFHSLIGWAVMALLLSAGAPFWQDTLESLFGLKNVLRKRSDTKNVEDKGGQPKP